MTQLLSVRVKNETDRALREYARKHDMRLGEATDRLLEWALLAPVDDAAEQLVMPHMRKMMSELLHNEIRVYLRQVFEELLDWSGRRTNSIVRGITEPQVDRLAAMIVLAGKEAAAGRRIASNIAINVTDYATSELEKNADDYAGKRVAQWRAKRQDQEPLKEPPNDHIS